MDFKEICRKIEALEIQGASDVAEKAMEALELRLKEKEPKGKEEAIKILKNAKRRLFKTRPTEPLMRNGIRFIIDKAKKEKDLEGLKETVERSRTKFFEMIEKGKDKIAKIGARRISGTVLTYCHSSTALGVLKESKEDIGRVFLTETRPRYQGRITARELLEEGFKATMIVDSACRYFMKKMDYVIVGADVITSEGNIINKIGTSSVALAANEARIPFYVATNLLKFDPKTMSGALEKVEERSPKEVWSDMPDKIEKLSLTSKFDIKNPAFDVTPKEYIDGLITEDGIISPEMVIESVRKKFPFVLEE